MNATITQPSKRVAHRSNGKATQLSTTKPRFELVEVTPKLAAEWLTRAGNNRRLSRRRVNQYARDMTANAWTVNNDAITFDLEGNLSNGQHRLSGVVESGVTIPMLVGHGVPIRNLDTGKTRTFGDLLKLEGVTTKNAIAIGGAVSLWWSYRYKKIRSKDRPTRNELLSLVMSDSSFVTGLENDPSALRCCMLAFPSVVILTRYLFSKKDPKLATTFFEKLDTGENLRSTDPVYLLREMLLRGELRRGIRRESSEIVREQMLAYFIVAWNALRTGRRGTRLVWDTKPEVPKVL